MNELSPVTKLQEGLKQNHEWQLWFILMKRAKVR